MAPDRLIELRGAPPLSAKVIDGEDGPELVIVSSAASILEGDELAIEIVLEAGARLTVRSAGAQLAFPCLHGGSTRLAVSVAVGDGARLVWHPEPLVACAGARHRSAARIDLASTAELLWIEEVLLGRSGEAPAEIALATTLSIDRAGEPVVRDGWRTTAAEAFGPASIGAARYVGTAVDLGTGRLDVADPGVMSLAAGGALRRVIGADGTSRAVLARSVGRTLE